MPYQPDYAQGHGESPYPGYGQDGPPGRQHQYQQMMYQSGQNGGNDPYGHFQQQGQYHPVYHQPANSADPYQQVNTMPAMTYHHPQASPQIAQAASGFPSSYRHPSTHDYVARPGQFPAVEQMHMHTQPQQTYYQPAPSHRGPSSTQTMYHPAHQSPQISSLQKPVASPQQVPFASPQFQHGQIQQQQQPQQSPRQYQSQHQHQAQQSPRPYQQQQPQPQQQTRQLQQPQQAPRQYQAQQPQQSPRQYQQQHLPPPLSPQIHVQQQQQQHQHRNPSQQSPGDMQRPSSGVYVAIPSKSSQHYSTPHGPNTTTQHSPTLSTATQAGHRRNAPKQQQPNPKIPSAAATKVGNTTPVAPSPNTSQHALASTPMPRPRVDNQVPRSTSNTSSSRQVVAGVRIPAVQNNTAPQDYAMAPAPKRRRLSEDKPTLPRELPKSAKPTQIHNVKSLAPSSSPLTELNSSQMPSTPGSTVDLQAVLLSLADEYIREAYNMSARIASPTAPEDQLDQYHCLMATGMGCLQSVLQNYRISDPRKEVRIRLKLANLLIDETENIDVAEEILSKAITLCENSNLSNMKYAAHHLLVRIQLKTNDKMAVRSLDRLIEEVSMMQLHHWTYTFRLFRVSLGLQNSRSAEVPVLLRHLAAVQTLATRERHVAVQIVTATLEALVHLRSGSSEAVHLAQGPLAAARTHQFSSEMQQIPPVLFLLDCLDLACNFISFNSDQLHSILRQIHSRMDAADKSAGWSKTGRFSVSLGTPAPADLEEDTAGILAQAETGEMALPFKWLNRNQLHTLGFVLSSLAYMPKTGSDSRTETMLTEGLKLNMTFDTSSPQSLSAWRAQNDERSSTDLVMRLYIVFAHCGRADWSTAEAALQKLSAYLPTVDTSCNASVNQLLLYLNAVCKHGLGDLEAAYELYKSPQLMFDEETNEFSADRDLRALAALNSILLLRSLTPEDQLMSELLMASVEPYCLAHPNQGIVSAFWMIKAMADEHSMTMIKMKDCLQRSLKAAQKCANSQLISIVMNTVMYKFFTNIVGEQADKSARTGRSTAIASRDKLWLAVANGMSCANYELNGKHAEAHQAMVEAQAAMAAVPTAVQKKFEGPRIQ